ncbi:hypothetical protein BGZ49_004963 [Haplosporangium sp. Z 27]|nr:hypothetical protein BGZ49_004963 [Haplosporangium sp. Z 27]
MPSHQDLDQSHRTEQAASNLISDHPNPPGISTDTVSKPYPRINFGSKIETLPTPLTIDYLFYYTDQYLIPRSFRAFELLDPSIEKTQNRSTKEQLLAKANTNLSLALSGHFPNRIQVLSMTPSQLARIWSSSIDDNSGSGVQALSMMKRLELDFGAANSPMSAWNSNAHDAAGSQNLDLLQIPLKFIQEHQKIFGAQVKVSSEPNRLQRGNDNDEGTLLEELMIRGSHQTWSPIDLLSQIAPLKVIDLSAWNSHVPGFSQIPSSRLQSLRINLERRIDFIEVPIPFLQSCKRLQEIWLPAETSDTFQWAIDLSRPIGSFVSEARLRRRRGINTPNIGSNATLNAGNVVGITEAFATPGIEHNLNALVAVQNQLQQELPQHDPGRSFDATQSPQLQKIKVYGSPRELVTSLEDAADAFRDTLVELIASEDGYSRREIYPHMSISWLLPQLTRLDLTGRFVFYFDLQSLRFAPNLRVVKLHVESNILPENGTERDGGYEAPDFSVFTGLRLEELKLRGTSWGIDDTALEILTGGPSLSSSNAQDHGQQQQEHRQRPCSLRETLLSFDIADSHMIHRAGLKRFVREMRKLQLIQLGTHYKYLADSLREEAGPRLYVDVSLS